MSVLRENIAKNISDLRKKNNWTQAELAERLNYSDKAISKWERGESVPDIEVMYQMASLLNVSVDYLCSEHEEEEKGSRVRYHSGLYTRRILQILLWGVTFFFLGTVVFVYQKIGGNDWPGLWIWFVWPVPACGLLTTILLYKFRMHKAVPFALSATLWTLLAALYLQALVLNNNIWLIFLIGVPLQIIIFLAFWLRLGTFRDDEDSSEGSGQKK